VANFFLLNTPEALREQTPNRGGGGYSSKRILWEMRFACIFQEFSSRRLINTDKIYGPKKERTKREGHDNVYMYILYIYTNKYLSATKQEKQLVD